MDSILIVDDSGLNRLVLKNILKDEYETIETANGFEALDVLFGIDKLPQAILLDIVMPKMDGFEVLKKIKENPRTRDIPVLFISGSNAENNEMRGLQAGAADYVSKPFNPDIVKARINNHVELRRYRETLQHMLEEKTEELIATHERTLEVLATIIEYRSLESGMHIRRTVGLTEVIVDYLMKRGLFDAELTQKQAKSIVKAVSLHDIGKIGIEDSILLKPGRLNASEFEVIKKHTTIGCGIIDRIAKDLHYDGYYLKAAREICRSHHERWDGNGYPDKLKGEGIPLSARILSVIDVYDALVSVRCYKPAYTHEEAIHIIKQGRKTQFDPEILDAFLEVADDIKVVSWKISEEQASAEQAFA